MHKQFNSVPGKAYLRWLRIRMRTWTQFAFARDIDDNSVDPKDPKAIAWDLEGAMRLWHGGMQWELQKRFQPYTKQHLCIYNDQMIKSNQEVIDLINKLLEEFND